MNLTESFMHVAARLPFGMLYAMSYVASFVLRRIVRYRLRVVRENLAASFPEKSREELIRIERDFYLHFTDNAVESVKLLCISADEMRRRMMFENVEIIDEYFAQGRDIVAYFSHCGNWEWATSVSLHTHAQADYGFVYRPLKSAVFDALMLELRTRFGASAYPKAAVFRDLLRLRRDGKRFITGFMSDQKPSHGDPTYVMMFLNHPTAMITGTETLVRKLDTAVIYWDMERLSRGHYKIVCRKMCDYPAQLPEHALTAEYARMLEQTIRRNPSIWLWSHRRWKISVEMLEL